MARWRPAALLVVALAAVLSAAQRAEALSVTVTDTECIHEFVPYEGDTVSGNFVVVDHDIFWSSDHPGIDLTPLTPRRRRPPIVRKKEPPAVTEGGRTWAIREAGRVAWLLVHPVDFAFSCSGASNRRGKGCRATRGEGDAARAPICAAHNLLSSSTPAMAELEPSHVRGAAGMGCSCQRRRTRMGGAA